MGDGPQLAYTRLVETNKTATFPQKLIVRNRGWCGGWDLNPRRPTPSGPQPDPFDLARAPPLTVPFSYVVSGVF